MRVLGSAQALRNVLPEATIDFAVAGMASEVVEGHEALNSVLVCNPPRHLIQWPLVVLRYLRLVRRQGYDVVLDFHGVDWRGALVVLASGAGRRIGFPRWRCRELSYLFTNVKVPLPSSFMNRVDEFTALMRSIAPEVTPVRAQIALSPQQREQALRFWQQNIHPSRRTVIIHCPVNDLRKRWPLPRFAELADRLLSEAKVNVLLTCGPGQIGQLNAVLSHMKDASVLTTEITSIKTLAAFLERADLFVGNDTGPMHIANAIGTPVVALFTSYFVISHCPYWQPRKVIYYPMHKQRGLVKKVGEAEGGLYYIDVDTVFNACIEMLKASPRHSLCKAIAT